MDTLRALEEAIDAFPGCAVIVSHDRYFLDKIATHTLAFEDDGGVVSLVRGSSAPYLSSAEAIDEKTVGAFGDGNKMVSLEDVPRVALYAGVVRGQLC